MCPGNIGKVVIVQQWKFRRVIRQKKMLSIIVSLPSFSYVLRIWFQKSNLKWKKCMHWKLKKERDVVICSFSKIISRHTPLFSRFTMNRFTKKNSAKIQNAQNDFRFLHFYSLWKREKRCLLHSLIESSPDEIITANPNFPTNEAMVPN